MLFILDETAEDLVLFGWYIVALSFIWIPHLAVFAEPVSSKHKYAFSIWKSLADNQKRLVVSSSLKSIDEVEVITQ